MNSMRLYEISNEYQFLLNDLYDEESGVIDENVMSRLNHLADTAENKCINITKIFKDIDHQREAIAQEKKKMQARENALKNQVERLKDYLRTNMERCEIKKIECPQFSISLQANPAAVEVFDKDAIPATYDKTLDREVDISKIKADLKNGVVIPGARLVQGSSIRIR